MRGSRSYPLALAFVVGGALVGGVFGPLEGLIVWGVVDQVARRRAGTWSPRRYPWQRTAR